MQGKPPTGGTDLWGLQPRQAPNLLSEGGRAPLPVENVPLALGRGEHRQSSLCHAFAC